MVIDLSEAFHEIVETVEIGVALELRSRGAREPPYGPGGPESRIG